VIEERTRKLAATVSKLYRRGAERNIKNIIAKSHSADIAGVLEALEADKRLNVFKMVPSLEMKAEILSHMNQSLQEEISVALNPQDVQDIVAQMPTDDAADLLGHLPDDLTKKLLKGMPKEDGQEVRELMGYPDGTAGALMTPEFLALNENLSISEAIKVIQASDEDLIFFYVYVTNEAHQLVGVLSLKKLLIHKPGVTIKDVMETDVISVDVTTSQEDVSKIVEKYDFLALPVIDRDKNLVGVITVDVVIDAIREEASDELLSRGMAGTSDHEGFWDHFLARLPWFFICLASGLVCFYALYNGLLRKSLDIPWELVCMIPMALFLVTILSNQTATLAVDFFRSNQENYEGLWPIFKQEFALAFLMGSALSVISLGIFILLPVKNEIYYMFSMSFLLLVISAVLLSILIPWTYKKWEKEVDVSAIPLAVILSNFMSIMILATFLYV
jgi:magnesium transporter